MAFFFQIEASLSLKNAWRAPVHGYTPNFLFGYQKHLLIKLCFLRSFLKLKKPHKNIPVFTTNGKPEYLETRRTYAQ